MNSTLHGYPNPQLEQAPSPQAVSELRTALELARGNLAAARQIVLAVVAHPDDEAIGPGGTLFTLNQMPGTAVFLMVAATPNSTRRLESQTASALLTIPAEQVFLFDFQDGALGQAEPDLRAVLSEFADIIRPSIILTHKEDMHPDHGVLFRLVRQVFARSGVSILHFQIPQPAVTIWHPTVFFRLSSELADAKVHQLFAIYRSENWKDYFDPVVAEGILRQAGHCAGSERGEAFECTQLSLMVCPCGCGLVVGLGPQSNRGRLLEFASEDIVRVVLEVCPCGCGAIALAHIGNHNGKHAHSSEKHGL